MTLQVHCKRCGRAFTPPRRDIVRGDWRICPGCRGKASGDDGAAQRPITPDGPTNATTGRTGAPERQEAA